ncbi:hypothetical protein M0805_004736 [Coniferiporia weirii]|nr:hypothetical protein M0805_004736 [Coniferiporia weirii]
MFARANTEPDSFNAPSESVRRLKLLFVFLQAFGGQIGLPLFVGTMLIAPGVKRHLTLVNFLASWIINSVVYCLTVYHGGDRSSGLGGRICVVQAVMVHGVVPLAVVAYCALHIQVWLGVRTVFHGDSWIHQQRQKLLIVMFFAPYIVFIAFCVASVVIILEHPETIDRNGAYYCTIDFTPLTYAVPGFCAGVIAIMLILEVMIGCTLVRQWKTIRRSSRMNAASLSMIVRIAVFSVYGFATLAACAAFLAHSLVVWPYFVQASLPTAIFLVFGNRLDVWSVWCFWRRRHRGARAGMVSHDLRGRALAIHVTLDTVADISGDTVADLSVGSSGVYETGDEQECALDGAVVAEKADVLPEKLPEQL